MMFYRTSMFCLLFVTFQAFIFLTEIGGNNHVLAGKVKSRNRYFSDKEGYQVKHRKGKPVQFSVLKNTTVRLGRTAVFRCVITGSPSRIRWRHNGRNVPQIVRYRSRSYSWGGVLRVKNVQVSDYGVYTCRARNSFGQMKSNEAYLKIRGVNPLHRERCEMYEENLCSTHISSSRVFIKFGQTQRETEKKVKDIFRRMSLYISQKCKTYLLPSLCKYYFPPCDPNRKKAKAVPICKKDCSFLEQNVCQSGFNIVRAISVKLHFQLPVCANLPTADAKSSPTNCQRIFSSKMINKATETSAVTRRENPVELLKTLFTIVSGIPRDTEVRPQNTMKRRDPPVNIDRSEDDHQKYKGKCEPYRGEVCLDYIKAGRLIFIAENRTQQGYETKLIRSLPAVRPFITNSCRDFALKALCYYFFPPCLADNITPNLICRKDCEILEAQICSKEFQYAKTMRIGGEIIPDCVYLPERQETCLELGVSDGGGVEGLRCYGKPPQGKIVPQRPHQFKNSSDWCKAEYHMISFNLLPNVVKQRLENIVENGSSINVSKITQDKGQTEKYCIQLKNKTPQGLFNSSYMKTVVLPNMVRSDPLSLVSGIVMYVKNNSSTQTEILLGHLPVYRPHQYLQLSNVNISYRSTGTHNTFVGRGNYHLCGSTFDVEIARTEMDNVRIHGQSSDPVDVDKIELTFGAKRASERMLKVLNTYGVFSLRIMNPKVEMYLSTHVSAKFSGLTYVESLRTNAKTEIYVGKLYKKYLLTTGMIFKDIPLGTFVSSFSGIYLKYLDIFQHKSGNGKIGLSLSANEVDTTNIPFMAYTSEPLASAFNRTIPKGFYMAALTGTSKNCQEHNTFCKLIQIVVGKNRDFMLTGETSWQWTHFKASIQNPAMSQQLPVEKVNIEIKGSNKTGLLFGVQPYIAYNVKGDVLPLDEKLKRIVFTGTLYYSTSGRQLDGILKTNAVWKNAFGFPQVTVKRMTAGLSVRLVRPHFPNKLEARGDFEIGLHCSDYENDCITGTAYIGMSDERNEQYFHGIVSRFTIQDILRVHGVQSTLPAPIANIGFPDGLEIMFAKQTHNLEAIGGPIIKPGFTMRGKIRILGLESDCSVNLKPNEFIVDAEINGNKGPIKLGGVTPMYRSKRDRKNGPKLYLEARFAPNTYIKAHIDGYTRIFGVFDEIRILMTKRHFMIRLVTSIFQSFKVRINVMANYSANLNRTHFKARVVFISGLARLTRASSKHVMKIVKNERRKLQTAREKMNVIKTDCHTDSKADCDACLKFSTCQTKLNSCREKLTLKERLEYSRSSANHFCQRIVRKNCQLTADDCQALCQNTTRTNHSCKILDQSQRTIEEMKKSLLWVTQVKALFSSGLCQVHSITFETKLTPDYIGDKYVNAKLDITIFGQRRQIDGMRLKFGQFARLAADVASNAVEWYRKTNT